MADIKMYPDDVLYIYNKDGKLLFGGIYELVLDFCHKGMEEDLYRIETLRNYKIDPFVMPYNRFDNHQRGLARWVNHKAIFNSCTWTEYCETKGIEV